MHLTTSLKLALSLWFKENISKSTDAILLSQRPLQKSILPSQRNWNEQHRHSECIDHFRSVHLVPLAFSHLKSVVELLEFQEFFERLVKRSNYRLISDLLRV